MSENGEKMAGIIRQYAPLILAAAVGMGAGGTGIKLWDQAQIDRMEKEQTEQTRHLEIIEATLQRFHGALDACRDRPAWDDKPVDYYRGREEQEDVEERADAGSAEIPGDP